MSCPPLIFHFILSFKNGAILSYAELGVTWTRPAVLNGELLRYDLRMETELVYSGLNTTATISGLLPYTQYRFTVQACTGGYTPSFGDCGICASTILYYTILYNVAVFSYYRL